MSQPNPVQTFLLEADDLLATIEDIVLDLAGDTANPEAVNQLFRAFHTIKGSGAMFGFEAVAAFTHHVETALDGVRGGTLVLSAPFIECVLAARDEIKALLDETRGGPPSSAAARAQIVSKLAALCGDSPASSLITPAPAAKAPTPSAGKASAPDPVTVWRIRFQPNPNLLVCGGNPTQLLAELRALGECSVTACCGTLPPLEQLEPDQCYLGWDLTLRTSADVNAIKDVFIFVEDGAALSITPAAEPPADDAPAASLPVPPPAVTSTTSLPALVMPASASPAPKAQARPSDANVRVPSEKLDRLVNLVGELVMNQSRVSQVARRIDRGELTSPVEEIERLIDELRDTVLGIRMMPIGSTFSRFKRLVHDLSAELGKEIDLVTEGAETELDKTVLDRLGEPLVHLIRNSLDHGIEPVETRLQRGKPRRGTIRLSAAHTGSNVVLSIHDDGRGLDHEAIRRKAIEKGLAAADAVLSERDTFNLIFLPGFSTARQVTSVSGRGVGMDVVKRQIDALRGAVSLASTVGQGTTITLTLPLTLAIVDGLVVAVGNDQFVIPTAVVLENAELSCAERSAFNGRALLPVRGELVPYLRLREAFALPGTGPVVEKIVIVQHAGERFGLVVDRVLGSHQTVIQALGRFYRDVPILSGATIMGDGRVALILDVGGLARFAERSPAARPSPSVPAPSLPTRL